MPSEYPKISNPNLLHESILLACRRFRDKPALKKSRDSENHFTFGDIERISPRIAYELRRRGVKRGDRIGLLSENRPEWGVVYLSILCAGGVVVPLDATLKPGELSKLIKWSEIEILFTSEKLNSQITGLLNNGEIKVKTIIIDQIREFISDNSGSFLCDQLNPSDPASLIYTSGTTGDPKAVILTHQNLRANLDGIAEILKLRDDDIFLSILPLHHTFETTCGLLNSLSQGITTVYAHSLKSNDIIDDIKTHEVTSLIGVPLLYDKMYRAMQKRINELAFPKRLMIEGSYSLCRLCWRFGIRAGRTFLGRLRKKAGLGSIRLFVSGGAPLPREVAEWFNIIGFNFLEGYGLTECAPVVSVNRINNIKFGSVGPPLPNVEVVIKNPSAEGIGEILVRAESVTPGYLNNRTASDELLKGGWLHTGDLGLMRKRHLYIKGRAKNLIVSSGGKNIYPEELEEVLCSSPYILEALVLGRKQGKNSDEKITAIILPDMAQFEVFGITDISESNIEKIKSAIKSEVDSANANLAGYKRIVNFELRFEEFAKTTSQKIKRALYK